MKIDLNKLVDIKNKSATFEFEILDKLTAGIVLTGTEIKSIRQQKVNVQDSFCQFKGKELYIVNLHIGIYKEGTYNNNDEYNLRMNILIDEINKNITTMCNGLVIKNLFFDEYILIGNCVTPLKWF